MNDYAELSIRMADLRYDKPAEIIKSDQEQIRDLITSLDQDQWGDIRAAFQGVKYARMSGGAKKKDPEYEAYQSVIEARSGRKGQLRSLGTDEREDDEQRFRQV